MFPQYSSNMSLVNQQDVRGLLGAALPQGLRNDKRYNLVGKLLFPIWLEWLNLKP